MTNPLDGVKMAGYVGCQTVRPFAETEGGGEYDTFDNPEFLDDCIEACGAEAVEYDVMTSCCGGSVSVMRPEKTLHPIKKILEAAVEAEADMIALPCPLCQANVEMYQDAISKKFGTDFNIPGSLLQPDHGGGLRHERQKGRRPGPEHHQGDQAGREGEVGGDSYVQAPA